jgi:hypothetical protein
MRKPAPLATGVLLKKGEAVPMAGSHGRDGPSIALPHAASAGTVAEAPARTRTAELEPLGFKVPPQFNQEFRRFAFENGYKLNELLFAAFDAFKKARIRESANSGRNIET